MIVCLCEGLSERDVERAIADGSRSLRALREHSGAGGSCGRCRCMLREMLDRKARGEAVETTDIAA